MAQPRPPPPPYSPSMAYSPPPPYRPPKAHRPTAVQQGGPDPGYNPSLPEGPDNAQGAVPAVAAKDRPPLGQTPNPVPQPVTAPTPEFDPPIPAMPENIQGAAVVPETYAQDGNAGQVARPGGNDEESQLHGAGPNKHERTQSAGEHRAERGEGRMKIRPMSWLINLAVWAMLLGALISIGRYRAVQKDNEGLRYTDNDYKDADPLSMILFVTFYFVFFVWYFGMCKDAGTRQFVANINRELSVQQYVQQLRTTTPVVQFDASCYHYETRTRSVPVTTTSASGHTTTTYRTETYTETVVTHSANEEYHFTHWEDATGPLLGTDSVRLTKLHLSKELGFLTDAAEQQLLAAYGSFCAANRRDVFQTYKKELQLEGFKERIMCFRNVDEAPCWVSSCGY
ncbi:unnamed protein product [Ectocarpus sp. 12 AP-2014]